MNKKFTWKKFIFLALLVGGVNNGIYSILITINDYNAKQERIRIELIEVAKDELILEMKQIALDKEWYGISGKNIEKTEIEKSVDKTCNQFIEKIKKYSNK